MNFVDLHLVRAHQADLLRAACTRRPQRCAETRAARLRPTRRRAA